MTLGAWVFCLPAAAVASPTRDTLHAPWASSCHVPTIAALSKGGLAPLILDKVCNQIRGSTQAWDLDFRNLWQFTSLCFSLGEKVRRRQMPPQKQFGECLHWGHQLFSVFTLALSFLRKVIRNWPRICPLRTSKIFSLGCTLWTNTWSVRLEKPLRALVSLTTSPLPQAPTLSRCHVHFPTGLFTLSSNVSARKADCLRVAWILTFSI